MTTAPHPPLTLGIDPGGRFTGLALTARDRDPRTGTPRLVTAGVLTRPAGPLLDPVGLPRWVAQVLEAVAGILEAGASLVGGMVTEQAETLAYLPAADATGPAPTVRPATAADLLELGGLIVAVESLTAPKGFAGGERAPIDPAGVIAAGVVLGAVLAAYPSAVVVDPGGNGSNPVDTYPTGIRKGAKLGGPSTHARSAFDVAFRAKATAAMRATFAAQPPTGPPARATRRR